MQNMILLERRETHYLLTLNDPDRRNALSDALVDDFVAALKQIEADTAVHVAIITGAGKAFCAGADIKAFNRMDTEQANRYIEKLTGLFLSLRSSDKIWIAAINGPAVGGGAELVISCDLSLMSAEAKIGFPEINLGLIPGATGTVSLGCVVGQPKAKELLLTGKIIPAAEAAAIKLVTCVEPAANLLLACETLAVELHDKNPIALAAIKHVMCAHLHCRPEDAIRLEREAFSACFASDMSKKLRQTFEQRK
ncbi:MAG TPA: enoyl-CoA hydratase/isomerase family protein [bacterium]|nr:enoyl-CoA hydratase/isomerase family protein [bacterium]